MKSNEIVMKRLTFITIILCLGYFAKAFDRSKPLVDLQAVNVIEVDKFKGNDLSKVRSAVAAIPDDGTPTEVHFSKREYFMQTDKKGEPIFTLEGKSNVLINGNGCQFIFTNLNPTMARISGCNNIIVKDFSIDFDPLHFSQGEIIEVNVAQKYFIAHKDEGFPDFTDPRFGNEKLGKGFQDRLFVLLRDKNRTGMPARGSSNNYGAKFIEDIGGGDFKVGFDRIADVKEGDICVIVPHKYVSGAMFVLGGDGDQITLMDINQYGGTVAVNGTSRNINLINYKVIPKPGTGRLLSVCRDGFMATTNRIGPWLEGCEVVCNGDDGVNFHTPGFALMRNSLSADRRTVTFTARRCMANDSAIKRPIGESGDSLLIYDMFDGIVMQRLAIKEAKKTGQEIIATLSSQLSSSIDISRQDCQDRYAVFNTSFCSEGFVIRNCHFESTRRYALFLMEGKNGIVENCTFKTLSSGAVYTGIEHAKSVGCGMSSVIFRGNTFDDLYVCSQARAGAGWIVSSSNCSKYPHTQSSQVNNVVFENNIFKNVNDIVFFLSGTNNWQIRNNTFQCTSRIAKQGLNAIIQYGEANLRTTVDNNMVTR